MLEALESAIITDMEKQVLSLTNPYLQNPHWKQRMLQISAQTSTEVEHPELRSPTPSTHFKGDTVQGFSE